MSLTIDELKTDIAVLSTKKEKAVQDFHQIIGAISIIEEMIYRIENHKPEKDDDHPATMDSSQLETVESIAEFINNGSSSDSMTMP